MTVSKELGISNSLCKQMKYWYRLDFFWGGNWAIHRLWVNLADSDDRKKTALVLSLRGDSLSLS